MKNSHDRRQEAPPGDERWERELESAQCLCVRSEAGQAQEQLIVNFVHLHANVVTLRPASTAQVAHLEAALAGGPVPATVVDVDAMDWMCRASAVRHVRSHTGAGLACDAMERRTLR